MNKRMCLVFGVLLILFSGCRSVPGEKERINLNGMIYDSQNRPVVNYRIYIDGKGVCTSDIGGRFVIKNICKGEHVFSGYGEGYLNIEKTVAVYDKSQILYIRVPSIESRFKEAFEYIKKDEPERAEQLIRQVLESDAQNEDALYFISVIEKIKERKENDSQ